MFAAHLEDEPRLARQATIRRALLYSGLWHTGGSHVVARLGTESAERAFWPGVIGALMASNALYNLADPDGISTMIVMSVDIGVLSSAWLCGLGQEDQGEGPDFRRWMLESVLITFFGVVWPISAFSLPPLVSVAVFYRSVLVAGRVLLAATTNTAVVSFIGSSLASVYSWERIVAESIAAQMRALVPVMLWGDESFLGSLQNIFAFCWFGLCAIYHYFF